MAGRFDGWHHLKVRGDKALAARYLQEGRKWLGFLLDQQKLGGSQQVLEKRNAAGVVFRAELSGLQPILTIDVTNAKNPRIEPVVLEGFITRPSPDGNQWENTDKNHVLLVPGGEVFNPVFFDAAATPEAYEGASTYSEIFPDGIGRYGNVDWRNSDSSVVLSWMGPTGRYFGQTGNDRGGFWVFLHGQVLFDFQEPDAFAPFLNAVPEVEPNGEVRVRGAWLRSADGQTWLYVCGRDQGNGEFLLRYPLTSPVLQKRFQAQGIEAAVQFYADVEVVYTAGQLLLTAETNMFNDGVHPYFANPQGTEARRIYEGDNTMWELRLTLDDNDPEIWGRAEVEHGPFTRTTTETGERTLGTVGTFDRTWIWTERTGAPFGAVTHDSQNVYNYPWGWDSPPPSTPPNHSVSDWVAVTHSVLSYERVPSATWVPFATEFADGEWQVAELRLPQTNRASEMTVDPSISLLAEDVQNPPWSTGGDTEPGPSIPLGPTDGFEEYNGQSVIEGVESETVIAGGIRTPFLELVYGDESTNTVTALHTRHLRYEYTYEHDGAASVETLNEQSEHFEFANLYEKTTTEVAFNYLDLRFGTAYYLHKTRTTTSEASGDSNDPEDTLGVAYTRTTTYQDTWLTRLVVNGETLNSYTQVDDPVIDSAVPGFVSDWHQTGVGTIFAGSEGFGTGNDFQVAGVPGQIGFLYWTLDLGGFTDEWHVHVAGSGAGPLTGAIGPDTDPASWDSMSADHVQVNRDFVDDLTDNYGSWEIVKGNWVISQQQTDKNNGGPQYAQFGSLGGLAELIDATTDAVRLDPVGYLSKTIIAVEHK